MANPIQQTGNVAAGVALGGSWFHYLPEWAAGFTILWLGMQMIIHFPELKQRLKDIFKKK